MADIWLDSVEQRLDIIESQVFGNVDKDVSYPKEADQVIDTLAKMNSQIESAVAGRKKIEGVLQRLPELDHLMDPAYTDKLTLSQSAKADIIITEEELIRRQALNLEKVEKMLSLLNSEHIKVVPSLQGKLHQLSQIHIHQEDATSEKTEEIKKLLLHYNTVINLLSKQFVQYDELLTKIEASKQRKLLED